MYTLLVVLLLLLPIPLYLGFKTLFKIEKNTGKAPAIKAALDRLIKKRGLSVSGITTLSDKIIAFDHGNNNLIWLVQANNTVVENCFSIKDIYLCRIIKKANPLTDCTSKIMMEIILHHSKEALCFTFYDEVTDAAPELPSRVRKANYWKSRIQLQVNRFKTEHMFEYVL